MTKKFIILFEVLILGATPLMDSSARFRWGPWYGAPLAVGLVTVAALPLVLKRNDDTIYVPQSFYQQYNQAPFIQSSPPPVVIVYVQHPNQQNMQGASPQPIVIPSPNQQYPQGNSQPIAIIPYNPSPSTLTTVS